MISWNALHFTIRECAINETKGRGFFMELHPNVASLLESCVSTRRALHRIPETAYSETETQAFVEAALRLCEPDSLERIAGTGVKAVYYARQPRSTIAFRADMDALNVEEQNQVAYRSEHAGKMHACGHDGHMTMLLLLAKLLHAHRNKLQHNVVLLFQPAEEGFGGAGRMVAEGALKNPDVDRIYGLHVWPTVKKGKVAVRWGPMMAQTCEFNITVRGKSAHGAMPQLGVDAIVIAAELITMVQTVITRSVDPHQDALLTIGKIEGGRAHNVIADNVTMSGTLRAFSNEVFNELIARIERIVQGLQLATGAQIEFQKQMHYPRVDNPRALVEALYTLVDKDLDMVIADPVMTSEDFSFYQERVDGLFLLLGVEEEAHHAPLHNSMFDFDESALLTGVELYRRILGLFD